MTDDEATPAVTRRVALTTLSVVALAVIAASWSYLTNTRAPYGDDNSAHLALMMHIAKLWRLGITDLWWDQSNLGLPLFMAYQPLPALLTGTLAAVFEESGPQIVLFKGSIVLLWALMPAAWYLGGRWLGLDRAAALAFGLLTLATHDIHDVGFTVRSVTYGGLYTQVWGMFFLPMTVGAFRRYVIDEELPLVVPVACFVVLSMSHLFCGMFAGIASVVWLPFSGSKLWRRTRRALLVFVPALALMAFWLVPLVATDHLIGGLPWKNEYFNGWPAAELLRRVMGGDIFDHGRIPWLTALAGLGLVLVAWRRESHLERWLLGLSAVSLLLFMGRTNFGSLYDLLPMHAHINVMRYINAVQFCGLFLAAIAVVAAARWAATSARERVGNRLTRRALLTVAAVAAIGHTAERALDFRSTLETFNHHHPNVSYLVDHLDESPNQRLAVSKALNTTPHFYRDLLPALTGRAGLQSYALGYHATLSTYYADYLEYDADWLRLFNVGALVAQKPYREDVVALLHRTFDRGPFAVWSPPGANRWGYFEVVDTPIEIHGDYRAIRPAVRSILLPSFKRGELPVLEGPTEISRRANAPVLVGPDGRQVAWSGESSSHEWRELVASSEPTRAGGASVSAFERTPNSYQAFVESDRARRVVLKVNYFPFWHARVDEEPVPIDHVAPNFMAVDLPAGRSAVRFEYRNPWWQKAGLVFMLVFLMGWSGWSATTKRERED